MRNVYTSSNHVHDTGNANCSEYSFRRQSTFPETNESDREQQYALRLSNTSDTTSSSVVWDNSPPSLPATPLCDMSYSPLSRSPWSSLAAASEFYNNSSSLIRSLVREKGHVYSLAASGDLLYTGSDSKNIRIWKNHKEFSGFKSSSGLVKAIVIAAERIFTGHQDGKIRVWKVSKKDQSIHKKVGTLPTLKAKVKSSFNPSNYVEVRRNRTAIWIKHVDAISCLSLSEDKMLLYSASWDKRIKVWRLLDSKCLESINAHDDAVNAVVAGFDGLVFSGSADGTVKVWRREMQGKGTKHFFSQTLIKQESAVTSLAVDPSATILYAGSSDGLVNFWERHKFLSHGGVLRGHKLAVLCLATAGDLVLSGSADTSICVWRREGEGDHACLSVLNGHSGPVKCLAVEEEKAGRFGHQDNRQYIVYSGSLDKSVKIWRVSGDTEVMQTPRGSWSQTQERSNWDDSLSRKLHAIQKQQQQAQLCSPTQNQHPERFSGQSNAVRTPRTKPSSPMPHGLLTQNQHSERLSGQLNEVQMQQMTQNQTPGRSSGQMNDVRTQQSSPVIHYSPKQNQSLERFPLQFNAIQTQQSLPKQHYSTKQHQSLERFPGQFNAIQMQPGSPLQHGLTTQNLNPARISGQLNTIVTRPIPRIENPNLEKFSRQLKAIQTRASPSTRNQNLERFSGRFQPSTPGQQHDHVENCDSLWNFPSSSGQDFSNQGIRYRMSRRTRY